MRAGSVSEAVRALARALLDGEPRAMQSRFPVLQQLLARVRSAQQRGELNAELDARTLVATAGALGLGWSLFERYLLIATGQTRADTETARHHLAETLARLFRPG